MIIFQLTIALLLLCGIVLLQGTQDKDGEYSYLITECGTHWFSVNSYPMRRNGCICPKCGKTVKVIIR